jgi:hypothetical protein
MKQHGNDASCVTGNGFFFLDKGGCLRAAPFPFWLPPAKAVFFVEMSNFYVACKGNVDGAIIGPVLHPLFLVYSP